MSCAESGPLIKKQRKNTPMPKVTAAKIAAFFSEKKLAVAGASKTPQKFGHEIVKHLVSSGSTVFPVNPNADKILGLQCFKSTEELPDDVDRLLIVTPKRETDAILQQAAARGISHIWVQPGAESPTTRRIAADLSQNVIVGKCIYMFAEPVQSIHKFHRGLVRFFGGLPK